MLCETWAAHVRLFIYGITTDNCHNNRNISVVLPECAIIKLYLQTGVGANTV